MKKYFVSFFCPNWINSALSFCKNDFIEFNEVKTKEDILKLQQYLQKENANSALVLLNFQKL